jgi:hypothetical protein
MFKIIPWSIDLDLSDFYRMADERGLYNNNSQKVLVDCFDREPEKCVWILYYNDIAVGSCAAHTFDIMGENCYRICARTCVFSDILADSIGRPGLRTVRGITELQNTAAQFFVPVGIDWSPPGSRVFVTTTESDLASQSLMHRIACPTMAKAGQMQRVGEVLYRNTNQTVWEVLKDNYKRDLAKYPRWT